MKEAIVKRIEELKQGIQQVVVNHALLSGQLVEAENILKTIFNAECQANPEIAAVAAAVPAVEAAVSAVEGVIEGKPAPASLPN